MVFRLCVLAILLMKKLIRLFLSFSQRTGMFRNFILVLILLNLQEWNNRKLIIILKFLIMIIFPARKVPVPDKKYISFLI